MQEQIFDSVLNKEDLSWQSLIYELIKTNQLDPWDVDVSVLTQKYIEIIKKLKEMDFNLSGKVVLAAAVLLKIKSSKLVTDDMNALDSLFAQSHETDDDDGFDDYDDDMDNGPVRRVAEGDQLKLIPRTPQPRRRKVTIYDLMDALQKAMDVKKRRVMRTIPEDITIRIPKKSFDITQVIREMFGSIKLHFLKKQDMTFKQLLPNDAQKDDKVYTFIPLLHLANARKVDIAQSEHFGDINIFMAGKGPKLEWDPEKESAMFRIKEKRKADRASEKAKKGSLKKVKDKKETKQAVLV